MRSVRLFFLATLFITMFSRTSVFGQQEFMLNGALIENGSKIRVALAEITNKRNHYSVGSNDLGLFQIKSMLGDTLLITKRGFNDLLIVVNATKDLVLYLNKGNMLNEVVVNGQSKKQALDAIEQDFKDKGSFYAGKPPIALLSPFGGSPLTFLYELFGRTPKNARRFKNYHRTELKESHTDEFFNKTIIYNNTGLTGKQLEEFMVNYRPDYEETKNWTTYDGVKWIKDSYKKYMDSIKTPF